MKKSPTLTFAHISLAELNYIATAIWKGGKGGWEMSFNWVHTAPNTVVAVKWNSISKDPDRLEWTPAAIKLKCPRCGHTLLMIVKPPADQRSESNLVSLHQLLVDLGVSLGALFPCGKRRGILCSGATTTKYCRLGGFR